MTNASPQEGKREGSLEAPIRHALAWRSEAFYDVEAIEKEMERVFDICHGCRRCFNLCESFPRLFDMVDESPTGELDGVPKERYAEVVEGCTLCDMCFMTKCPYVPPHEWALDFPHLMLRYRAAELRKKKAHPISEQLAETDRNGQIGKLAAPIANWATDRKNGFTRPLIEAVAGVDREAILPKFHSRLFVDRANLEPPHRDEEGPAKSRKAVLYATCFVNYNQPSVGEAAFAVLAHLGVDAVALHPMCCGMPQLEHGDIEEVARRAEKTAEAFAPYIDKGYDIIALTASCGLMLKFEWPLILPENAAVKRLSAATRDISEYVVDIAKIEGLKTGLEAPEGGVTVHMACHARAQNMGAKSAEMLRLIPGAKVDVVERCSGHGGTFGVMKKTRAMAVKVGKPAAKQVAQKNNGAVCSDCPLACKHLNQLNAEAAHQAQPASLHPIEIFARAYGLVEGA